jgi:hypothetical protein
VSYSATEWCRPLKIRGWAKAILACLADHHNETTGRCDPSLATIAHETGCSESTARRGLRELEQTGVIRATKREGRPDLVTLCLDQTVFTLTPLSPRHPYQGDTDPCQGDTPTPVTLQRTPVRVTPEPEEPEVEPEEPKTPLPPMLLGDLAGDGVAGCACADAKDAWNATAERCGWAKVQRFTPPRAKATEARLKELGGLAGWQMMLGKMEASPFFRRRWQPSFDWILKPANVTKVMEGNYDDRTAEPETGLLATLAALR